MELNNLYQILLDLALATEKAVGEKLIFEPAGDSDSHKELHLRRHHYKVPNGSPQVFAWCRVMPDGPSVVWPKKPCARVSILAKLLDNNDPQIRLLETHSSGDWGRSPGEFRGCIYGANNTAYNHVLYALVMACKNCLSRRVSK